MAQDLSAFGATTTAAEVITGVSLVGKRAIVTGASSSIGMETARARRGCRISTSQRRKAMFSELTRACGSGAGTESRHGLWRTRKPEN